MHLSEVTREQSPSPPSPDPLGPGPNPSRPQGRPGEHHLKVIEVNLNDSLSGPC